MAQVYHAMVDRRLCNFALHLMSARLVIDALPLQYYTQLLQGALEFASVRGRNFCDLYIRSLDWLFQLLNPFD